METHRTKWEFFSKSWFDYCIPFLSYYSLVMTNSLLLKMAIEIVEVDLPINSMVDLSIVL